MFLFFLQSTTETVIQSKDVVDDNKTRLATVATQTMHTSHWVDTSTESIQTDDISELISSDPVCGICVTRRANCTYLPCSHLFTCSICASNLIDCCVCRTRIEAFTFVYTVSV